MSSQGTIYKSSPLLLQSNSKIMGSYASNRYTVSLPSHDIKWNLTKYLWSHFTTNFNSDHSCTYHYLCPCYRCSRQPTSSNFHNLISATDTNNHLIINMWITVQSTVCIPVLSGCGHRWPTDLQSRSSCFLKH